MDRFVFRGQGNHQWPISHSLERSVAKYYPNNTDSMLAFIEEKAMIKEFKWKYPLYSKSKPDPKDIVEWLTIMQHHGAPTRLVDITRSLFVGIYFAISEHHTTDATVWAINSTILRGYLFERYRKRFNVNMASHEDISAYSHDCANELLTGVPVSEKMGAGVFYIEPKLANDRLARQQGAFLMPSDITQPFEKHLMSHVNNDRPLAIDFKPLINYAESAKYKQDDIAILKINIPHRLNFEIGKYLRAMNITTEILFPGLDGLCKSLAYLRMEGMGNPFKL
nr:FRG domain-containing protein [Mucilaginibacter sp. UR6-11]